MQKHRKRKPTGCRRNANANYLLPVAAQNSVFGLFNSIDGGEDFALSYLTEQFLTKYCDEKLVPGKARRANAVAKFLECERKNAEVNDSIGEISDDFNILNRVTFKSFLRFARKLVRDILGPLRDEVVLGSFSGGASTSRRRTESSPAQKFSGKADVTEGALCVLPVLHRLAPLAREYGVFHDLNIVEGNVLFTVPKKTDIDRCACKEPDVNMFLQKGVGKHIRRRLRRFGIDLNDQSINRRLAEKGSIDGSLATLDLSSASDTICREVVRALLPDEWFVYLDSIRSHFVEIDGRNHRMEMFSSMGNGFTFELESLIFLALCRSTAYFLNTPGIISIYGDDIVVPSELTEDLTFVLRKFGFSVNSEKSYHEGPFRESCGGHYHNGEDVTPFYLKRPATRLTDVIRVANQLRRWAMVGFRRYEYPWLYPMWVSLKELVPKGLWGGYDYSLDTQLVSADPPSKKLVRFSVEKEEPETGKYLQWHNTHWNRAAASEQENSEPVTTTQKCRLRRVPLGAPICQDWFLEELIHHTGRPR